MHTQLRALILDDSEQEARLLAAELRHGGFDVVYERVESGEAMRMALAAAWDVVISDLRMPHFSGLDALNVLKESGLDVPFILLSGVAGEEEGVEAIRRGVKDYLSKKNLARLVPAVERELGEARVRRERRGEEELLRLHTAALTATANGIVITDQKGTIVWTNLAVTGLTGYSAPELKGRNPRIFKSGLQDPAVYRNLWGTILNGQVWNGEIVNLRKDGISYNEEMTITPIKDAVGTITNFIAVKQDVTQRKKAADTLLASEIRYRRLFEAAQDGILILDAVTSAITDVNPFLVALLGYAREEMVGRKLWEIGPFQDIAASKEAFQSLQAGGYIRYEDLPLETKSGVTIDVEFVSNAYLANGTKVIQCNIRDVTSQKLVQLAQKALFTSEIRYRRLFEAAQDGILILDAVTSAITDVNPFLVALLGYAREEMVGRKLWEIGPFQDIAASKDAFQSLQEGGYIRYEDLPLETKSGVTIDVEFVSNAYLANGTKVIQCNIRDVTARKRAEKAKDENERQLSTALAAKLVLLQEVHHRVKNNLQIISSLLYLQSETLSAEAKSALEDSQRRVRAMALVHEQLYTRDDPADLDFAEYAKSLTTDLMNVCSTGSGVCLRLELEPVFIGVDQAIPCGLILNELVTNALKHAFPESRAGEVLVELKCQDNVNVKLRVADNGIGLRPGFDWEHANTLGLHIIDLLTRQLKGTLLHEPGAGAAFTVTFAKRRMPFPKLGT